MNGTLSQKEFQAVQKALRQMEEMRPFVFSTDITSATTVSGVQAKIQEYQPDVVFVDGAYLMQSEVKDVEQGSPQAMTDISRGLKRLAQQQKMPICVTTQASLARSKWGSSLSSAMYTQAWGQDCDVLLDSASATTTRKTRTRGRRSSPSRSRSPAPVHARTPSWSGTGRTAR